MSETLPISKEIRLNPTGVEYHQNGTFMSVNRRLTNESRLDLLPIYGLAQRHKQFFTDAIMHVGDYRFTKVNLAEFMLEDEYASLETLEVHPSYFNGMSTSCLPKFSVSDSLARFRVDDEGNELLDVSLELDSSQGAEREVELIKRAFRGSDIRYRRCERSDKLNPWAPELFLCTFESSQGFSDENVDSFLRSVLESAPAHVQAEPFVAMRSR